VGQRSKEEEKQKGLVAWLLREEALFTSTCNHYGITSHGMADEYGPHDV